MAARRMLTSTLQFHFALLRRLSWYLDLADLAMLEGDDFTDGRTASVIMLGQLRLGMRMQLICQGGGNGCHFTIRARWWRKSVKAVLMDKFHRTGGASVDTQRR